MNFFPNNGMYMGELPMNMPNGVPAGFNYMNDIFNRFNQFESRIKKLEQRVEKLEGNNKNNNSNDMNSLYML